MSHTRRNTGSPLSNSRAPRPASRSGEFRIVSDDSGRPSGFAHEKSAGDLFGLEDDEDLDVELDRVGPIDAKRRNAAQSGLRVVDDDDFPTPSKHLVELQTAPRRLPHETPSMVVDRVRRSASARAESNGSTRAALAAFAGFGEPPRSLWQTPRYAVRVLVRRRALRLSLLAARGYRSADRPVYVAALAAADEPAVRAGLFLLAAMMVGILAVAATFAWQSESHPEIWSLQHHE